MRSKRLRLTGPMLLLALWVAGCVYPFDPQDGEVLVVAHTVEGAPVAGVSAVLLTSDGAIANGLEGRTDAGGELLLEGAPVGTFVLSITPPTGHELADSQRSTVAVTVRDDRRTTVQVRLIPS